VRAVLKLSVRPNTSTEVLRAEDVVDALQLAALAFEIGDSKPLLVVNVMPSIDPVQRTAWLAPSAEAKALEHRVACVTTLALVEALAAVQMGRSTLFDLWPSLHAVSGCWVPPAARLLREAR
jgi:hypothetical protein